MEYCESYFCDMKDLGRPQFFNIEQCKNKLGHAWDTQDKKNERYTICVVLFQKATVDHLLFRFVLDDRCTRKAKVQPMKAVFIIFLLKRMSLNVGLWKESVYSERIAEANEDSLSIVEERDEWQEALWAAV